MTGEQDAQPAGTLVIAKVDARTPTAL